MKRYITMPAINRQVTIGQYVKAVKSAIHNPDLEYKTGITTRWPTKGREIRAQFMRGVHDRINQATPAIERGIQRRVNL